MNKRNNPGNVKGKDNWKGKTGSDARGHCLFDTPENGFRALLRTLESKWLAGKRTLAAIIASWAPADDTIGSIQGNPSNDPAEYARTLGEWLGVSPTAPLPSPGTDPLLWLRIARAVSRYEDGESWPLAASLRGMALWWEDFKR
jgi:hypothetical protein